MVESYIVYKFRDVYHLSTGAGFRNHPLPTNAAKLLVGSWASPLPLRLLLQWFETANPGPGWLRHPLKHV